MRAPALLRWVTVAVRCHLLTGGAPPTTTVKGGGGGRRERGASTSTFIAPVTPHVVFDVAVSDDAVLVTLVKSSIVGTGLAAAEHIAGHRGAAAATAHVAGDRHATMVTRDISRYTARDTITMGVGAGCAIQVHENIVSGNAFSSRRDERTNGAADSDVAGNAHLPAMGYPSPSDLSGGNKYSNFNRLPTTVTLQGIITVVHEFNDNVPSAAQE